MKNTYRSVLAHSDRRNKHSMKRWFTKDGNVFLTALKPGRSKVKMLADAVSAQGPIPGL